MVVINQDKEILYINPAAIKLFGENHEELILNIVDFGSKLKNVLSEVPINYKDRKLGYRGYVCVSETDWEGKEAYLLSIKHITEKVRS